MQDTKKIQSPKYRVFGNIDGTRYGDIIHQARYCELLFFKADSISFLLNGAMQTAKKGDVLLLSLSDDFFCENEESADAIGLHISPEVLRSLSTSKSDLTKLFTYAHRVENFGHAFLDKSVSTLRRIHELAQSDKFGDDVLSRAELSRLLVEVYDAYKNSGKKKGNSNEQRPANTITARSVMDYIDINFTDPQLTLNKIATAMFFSASRLSHIFKEETGESIYRYLTNKRLKHAHDLILRGSPVMEACSSSGFKSYCSFYRLYSKQYGTSPMASRPNK